MFLSIFKMMLNAERCSVLPSSTVREEKAVLIHQRLQHAHSGRDGDNSASTVSIGSRGEETHQEVLFASPGKASHQLPI
jgi:hypothetical protein